MNSSNLTAKIESVLFYKQEPVKVDELANICEVDESEDIRQAVSKLKTELEDRGMTLIQKEDAVEIVTDNEFSELIAKAKKKEVDTNLTSAQSEALALVAYLAPVSKAKIDFVRGVNSRAVLRNLSTRGLITKKGSGKTNRMYQLTSDALAHLGITNKEELPEYESTRQKLMKFVEEDEVFAKEKDQ